MKSGTTSLWTYLLSHTDVIPLTSADIDPEGKYHVMADKEVRFFNDPAYSDLVKTYGKSDAIDFYLDLFPLIPPPGVRSSDLMLMTNQGRITGEATPMYVGLPGTASRIKEALPHVKIIMLLRNPVDRAYSDYWFRKSLKTSNRDIFQTSGKLSHSEIFGKCVEMELEIARMCGMHNWAASPSLQGAAVLWACQKSMFFQIVAANETSSYCNPADKIHQSLCISAEVASNCQKLSTAFSLYAPALFEYSQLFPQENLLILTSERFFERPALLMNQVTEFLGLDQKDWSKVTQSTYNIVNPKRVAGSKQHLVTSSKGLQIGQSESPSEYPPLDPSVRSKLIQLMVPYNQMISSLLPGLSIDHWGKDAPLNPKIERATRPNPI